MSRIKRNGLSSAEREKIQDTLIDSLDVDVKRLEDDNAMLATMLRVAEHDAQAARDRLFAVEWALGVAVREIRGYQIEGRKNAEGKRWVSE